MTLKEKVFQNHMEIELRNGLKCIVVANELYDIYDGDFIGDSSDFYEDLTYLTSLDKDSDIIKVFNPITNEIVFKRKEELNQITQKQKQEYTQEMIDTLGKETTLVIAMEELAELQQQVSKLYRGKGNIENLVEEIADVYICIDLIMKASGATDEQLENWINKKMERNHLRIVNKEFK